jgi:RB1-inducible coiled-coil protein 1
VTSLQDLYNEILSSKEKYAEQLQLFDGSVAELRQINLPQCLLKSHEFSNLLSPSTKESFNFVTTNSADTVNDESLSLLDWISAHDKRSQLEELGVSCQKLLDQLSVGHLDELLRRMSTVQETLDNNEMKQISGLDERVHLMEQQLGMTAQLQQEQADVALGFQQNKMRVQTLRDASVLPDLCAGQERQLRMLMTNHLQLKDSRSRFAKAKRELCNNLHTRLRWIMFQQKQVADCDSSIILRCESLKKLKKKFEVIEQINTAARMFITTVVEVVRRRAYNKDFVTWRNEVIQLARDAYCEETALRQKFKEMIGTHFVQCLFPGLSDKLATISAGQLPVFNHSLPEVTEDDLDELRAALPSLVECARVSEPQHWFSKMTDKMYDRDSKVEELATSKEEAVELRNEIKELMKELEEVKARGEQEKLELRNQLESSFHDQIQRSVCLPVCGLVSLSVCLTVSLSIYISFVVVYLYCFPPTDLEKRKTMF